MFVTVPILFSSVLLYTFAKPAVRDLIVHERRDNIPEGFLHSGAAPEAISLNLRVALVSKDVPGLEKALYDVSTPDSELYGQHLSKQEVESLIAPSTNTTAAVNDWLSSHGLTGSSISPTGDWLGFSVDVKTANEIFDADFSVFTHQATGQQSIRTLSYSIPTPLQGHVEFIHPTILPGVFGRTSQSTSPSPPSGNKISSRAVPSSCATQITPACLQDLYLIPATLATQLSNKIAVSGFVDQWAQRPDLEDFLENLRTDLNPATTFALQTLDGGTDPQGPMFAGPLAVDIQYTIGIASGVPTPFASIGTDNTDGLDGFLDQASFLLAQATPQQVVTISYGFNEADLTVPLATKLCVAYMQLGARGISVLFNSGDGGVAGQQSQSCATFLPTFPSTCPFVTSCGGTTGIGPEIAASFSAGGFSTSGFFTTPSYQAASVKSYLTAIGNLNSGKFNPGGRGFPDVSAQSENFVIFNAGVEQTINGTAGSMSVFASVIALINDRLIAAGKSPLGFVNPLLYSTMASKAFTDITIGSNPGCGTNGFPALPGWDPVTGLGTPIFSGLLAAAGL